ncbi:MAG TPA: hypothetical protein VGB77_07445 [Abditibacteriaceae bacterium]
MPMLAAYAAWQDWDGIFLFDYHSSVENWDANKITSFFASSSDPNKMATMPAASLIFLGNLIEPVARKSTLVVPRGAITEAMARNTLSQFWDSNLGRLWSQNGGTRRDWLQSKMAVRFVEGTAPLSLERQFLPSSNAFTWQTDAPESSLLTINSEKTKGVIGFLGGQWIDLDGLVVQMEKTPRNFVTLTLTPRDGKPIAKSNSLLLTVLSSVENKDMQWNETRTSVGTNWGSGPTMAEAVPAQIIVRTNAKKATVWALDGSGKRTQTVPSQIVNGQLRFRIVPQSQTLWHEIETR